MQKLPAFNRTRIAPTPSGYLHMGNALSFMITARLARQAGAKLLLRIDDMDQQRVNLAYVQDIFDTLRFLNIEWDEGPRDVTDYQKNWSQLHRMELYDNALQQLEKQHEVFACNCSRALLQEHDGYPGNCRNKSMPLDTPDKAWRLYTHERPVVMNTLLNGSITEALPRRMKDFVVRKKDGYPAYQLSSLMDDLYFEVDMIVRGSDLYPSTIAQLYLANVLGRNAFADVAFHHHVLVMESGQQKLSKSAGSSSIKYLREQGKTFEEIYAKLRDMAGVSNFILD